MASWLIEWKSHPDTQWLKDAPSQPLQQSLKDLERGYKNFFQKRAAFPRFKKRGQNDAFRYPQGVKLDQTNNRISLPKLGWIRYRNSREVIGEVKNVTVSQSCGKWYVSIQTEYEVPEPVHKAASMVGLDAGVTKLATLSDGTVYQPVTLTMQIRRVRYTPVFYLNDFEKRLADLRRFRAMRDFMRGIQEAA